MQHVAYALWVLVVRPRIAGAGIFAAHATHELVNGMALRAARTFLWAQSCFSVRKSRRQECLRH